MVNRIEEPQIAHFVKPSDLTAEEVQSLRTLAAAPDLWSRGQCLAWIEKIEWWGGGPMGIRRVVEELRGGPVPGWPERRLAEEAAELLGALLEQLATDPRPEVGLDASDRLARLRGQDPGDRCTVAATPLADRVAESHPYYYYYGWLWSNDGRETQFNDSERKSLVALSTDPDLRRRDTCLSWVEVGRNQESNADRSLEALENVLACEDEGLRSKALSLIGETLERWPDRTWPLLERLAVTPPEVRELVGPFILEHVLEHNFGFHFGHIEDAVDRGNLGMLEVLDGCYRLGAARRHEDRIDALLLKYGITPQFSERYRKADEP
jgi:hypothetical protein